MNIQRINIEKKIYKCDIIISQTGIPCLWEQEWEFANGGSAFLITDSEGNKKESLYKYEKMIGFQALIPISIGDLIIKIEKNNFLFSSIEKNNKYIIIVYKILEIKKYALIQEIYKYEVEENSNISTTLFQPYLVEPIKIGIEKIKNHCHKAMYVL